MTFVNSLADMPRYLVVTWTLLLALGLVAFVSTMALKLLVHWLG